METEGLGFLKVTWTPQDWSQFWNWFTKPTPYAFLIFGALSSCSGLQSLFGTLTGKTWALFYGWVYRAKEPNQFWSLVAIYYLVGVLFIGIFLAYMV